MRCSFCKKAATATLLLLLFLNKAAALTIMINFSLPPQHSTDLSPTFRAHLEESVMDALFKEGLLFFDTHRNSQGSLVDDSLIRVGVKSKADYLLNLTPSPETNRLAYTLVALASREVLTEGSVGVECLSGRLPEEKEQIFGLLGKRVISLILPLIRS